MTIDEKLWPPEGEKVFKEIWPSDLVLDPAWSEFKLDQDIIKKTFWSSFTKTEAKLWPLEGE